MKTIDMLRVILDNRKTALTRAEVETEIRLRWGRLALWKFRVWLRWGYFKTGLKTISGEKR